MKKAFFLLSVVVLFSLAGTAMAAEFLAPNQSGQVNVSSSESHKNLYTAGGNVNIGGATTEDLTVAGGNVLLNGSVSGGLLAAGGSITINGQVGRNARVAGGNLNINAPVAGDLVVAGGNISLSGAANVGGDLVAASGNLNVNAPVSGNVRITGGEIYINGKINGTVNVTATKGLTFGPNAQVAGVINYRGPKEAVVESGAKVSGVNYTFWQVKRSGAHVGGLVTFGVLVQLLGLMVAGFLFLHFRRNALLENFNYMRSNPWTALGLGLVGVIVAPILVVLLFVTVIGYYTALVLLFSLITVFLLTCVMGALYLGQVVLRLFRKNVVEFPTWQVVVVGAIVYEVLRFIPVLGWLVLALVFLISFGSALVTIKNRLKQGV